MTSESCAEKFDGLEEEVEEEASFSEPLPK
jgi:hypothetical protein